MFRGKLGIVILAWCVAGAFGVAIAHNALHAKAKSKWYWERRAPIIKFRVPTGLKLKFTTRNEPLGKYPGMGAMDFYEFQNKEIRITFAVSRNMKFKDLYRAKCGNDMFETTLISSAKISKPKPGFFQERKFEGRHSMQLIMDGGADSYFFLVSWPMQGETDGSLSVSRDDFKQLVDSLQLVKARKDAGK